nr:hypothetical protein [Streptomyces sp. CYG20]
MHVHPLGPSGIHRGAGHHRPPGGGRPDLDLRVRRGGTGDRPTAARRREAGEDL